MLREIQRIAQVPELRSKILFTLLMLAVCRIGGFIPVPGINGEIAVSFFRNATGGGQNLFQMVDIFSGGAFSQMTVIALGVMPYISASIIMQLLVALWPSLQREIKENSEQGKRKVNKLTRILTVVLSFLQSALFAKYALQMNISRPGIIAGELLDVQIMGFPWLFYLITISAMTTGTVFLMWVGEQITEKGIGNGISLIISIGILSQLPTAFGLIFQQLNLDSQGPGQMTFASVLVLAGVFVAVTIATIMIIQGHRRIPLQYARRVVGRKEVQGGSSYIPLKVNYAGVIPVIFASSLLLFPATLSTFVGRGNFLGDVANWLSPGSSAENNVIHVELSDAHPNASNFHGLYRSIINNMVQGASHGFEKKLEMIGVGYRAAVQGHNLDLQIGYSHPTKLHIPEGVHVKVDKNTLIIITGADLQKIGQFAANVRAVRPPEPYQGKGIRYQGEYVRKKAGKAAAAKK